MTFVVTRHTTAIRHDNGHVSTQAYKNNGERDCDSVELVSHPHSFATVLDNLTTFTPVTMLSYTNFKLPSASVVVLGALSVSQSVTSVVALPAMNSLGSLSLESRAAAKVGEGQSNSLPSPPPSPLPSSTHSIPTTPTTLLVPAVMVVLLATGAEHRVSSATSKQRRSTPPGSAHVERRTERAI